MAHTDLARLRPGRLWGSGLAAALTGLSLVGWAGAAGAQQQQPALAPAVPLAESIRRVYQFLTGQEPPAELGLRGQIDRATELVYGAGWQGRVGEGLVQRVATLTELSRPGNPTVSLFSRALALEWGLNQGLYELHLVGSGGQLAVPPAGQPPLRPLAERVVWLETLLYGREQPGGLFDRLDQLARDIWGGIGQARLRTKAVTVGLGPLLVRVRLLGTLSNERASLTPPGTAVLIMALEDLWIADALVVPRGTVGVVRVEEAEPPGPLGRPGRLSASGDLWAIDGTRLTVRLRAEAGEGKESVDGGTARSTASGLLIQGEARTLQAGTTAVGQVGPLPGFTQQPVPEALVPINAP